MSKHHHDSNFDVNHQTYFFQPFPVYFLVITLQNPNISTTNSLLNISCAKMGGYKLLFSSPLSFKSYLSYFKLETPTLKHVYDTWPNSNCVPIFIFCWVWMNLINTISIVFANWMNWVVVHTSPTWLGGGY